MLGRLDWVLAGQDLLREGGIANVKLANLTAALGVTTGSFYHHFEDLGVYLDELADHYATTQPSAAFEVVRDLEPLERIRLLFTLADEQDIPRLDRAMRVWAASSPRAEAAVQKLDHAFLEFLAQAFRDLGLDEQDARVRAVLAFSAGAATVYSPWPKDLDTVERAIAVLTATPR